MVQAHLKPPEGRAERAGETEEGSKLSGLARKSSRGERPWRAVVNYAMQHTTMKWFLAGRAFPASVGLQLPAAAHPVRGGFAYMTFPTQRMRQRSGYSARVRYFPRRHENLRAGNCCPLRGARRNSSDCCCS